MGSHSSCMARQDCGQAAADPMSFDNIKTAMAAGHVNGRLVQAMATQEKQIKLQTIIILHDNDTT